MYMWLTEDTGKLFSGSKLFKFRNCSLKCNEEEAERTNKTIGSPCRNLAWYFTVGSASQLTIVIQT